MSRMLMNGAFAGSGCSPSRCRKWHKPQPVRTASAQRIQERQQWQRDYGDEMDIQAGEDERPIGYVERWPSR